MTEKKAQPAKAEPAVEVVRLEVLIASKVQVTGANGEKFYLEASHQPGVYYLRPMPTGG